MKLKRIFLASILSSLILGCYPLKTFDTTGFTTSALTVYYKGEEMATLTNIEYSIDNGKLVKEMTFRLKNQVHSDRVKNLLAFIHAKHKDWEIEIDLPISDTLNIEQIR
jgi:hypothetical protein